MSILGENIRRLRKDKGITQTEFAVQIGVKRAVIGAYEEGRAEPKLQTLQIMSRFFKLSIDALLNDMIGEGKVLQADISGSNLRILPVTLNASTDTETIPLVPIKASAGYAAGYGDVDFIGNLPQFQMPFAELQQNRTCRMFQIKGDSMLPVPPGAYILAEYVQDWSSIKDQTCCIVITRDEGVVYKRVINRFAESRELELVSDNKDYDAYTLPAEQIVELWKAKAYTTFVLPGPAEASTHDIRRLADVVMELKGEIRNLTLEIRK
jgi:transcriptional regulator with XRE-family HTH domain